MHLPPQVSFPKQINISIKNKQIHVSFYAKYDILNTKYCLKLIRKMYAQSSLITKI